MRFIATFFFPWQRKIIRPLQREIVKCIMLYSYHGALYYSEWEITIKVNNEKSSIIVEWKTQVAGQVTVTRCLLIQFLKNS